MEAVRVSGNIRPAFSWDVVKELKYAETADDNYTTISFSGGVASISNGENKLMAIVSNGSGGVKGTVTPENGIFIEVKNGASRKVSVK